MAAGGVCLDGVLIGGDHVTLSFILRNYERARTESGHNEAIMMSQGGFFGKNKNPPVSSIFLYSRAGCYNIF